MKYKADWEETKERFKAWWAHDNTGRCALNVTAPKENPPDIKEPLRPDTPLERWTDLDYMHELGDYRNSRTFYGGEAFPVWSYGYPGNKRLGAFLGCEVSLKFNTGWLEPVLNEEDITFQDLAIDEENEYWKFTLEWLKRGAKESKGISIPSIGAFGGSGDTLAAVRGTDRLLYDVMDRPDQVKEADLYCMDLWIRVYDRFYEIIKDSAQGSTCWFNLWSPGKFYASQNDFSYMISTEMFEELFIPTIRKQTDFLDHSVFHVDGIGAFKHVGVLCELANLQAFQILPGAGKPSPLHYMDVLKQVQAAGKNLHISIPASEVETALSELSALGLFISTSCKTEQEAKDLLRNAEKWSKF
ncbi:hypothetical protein ACFL6F_02515 [Planctomycetota bacterium]